MPRFYFNISDQPPDTDGREFETVSQAKCEAVKYAGELMCDAASTFWNSGDFIMTVTDDKGLALFSLHLIGTDSPALRSSQG
jgi:hypothetical protein